MLYMMTSFWLHLHQLLASNQVSLGIEPQCQLPLLLVHWSDWKETTHEIQCKCKNICWQNSGDQVYSSFKVYSSFALTDKTVTVQNFSYLIELCETLKHSFLWIYAFPGLIYWSYRMNIKWKSILPTKRQNNTTFQFKIRWYFLIETFKIPADKIFFIIS